MLPILLLCFFIGSSHSLFDVWVTVLDPICLDFYYDGTGTNRKYTQSQLQLEFHVAHGMRQSDSYYFVTAFEPYSDHSHLNFVKNDNTLPSIISHPLVLGAPIHLSAVSPYDDLTLAFDINPIIRWTDGGSLEKKCGADERIHSRTEELRTTLDAITTTTHQEKITIDLGGVPCLTTTQSWFKGYKPQVSVQVDYDCHGPCHNLFTTTTSTIVPLTTSATTTSPTTQHHATTPATTSHTTTVSGITSTTTTNPPTTSTMTTVTTTSTLASSSATTGYITSGTMTGYTTSGQNTTQDSDKLIVPLVIVAVIAVLELIVVIGAVVFILRKIRPNYFNRRQKQAETSAVYYDAGVPRSRSQGPTAPSEDIEYYTEMDDASEEYAKVNKPSRNQKSHDQNNFADNALYGH